MSSPPQTPTHRPASSHRRHPSSLDMSYNTPSRRQSFNRRSSGYSPVTPRSSHEFEHGSPAQHFDGGGDSNGLGNLADELGEIWDDDEEAADEEFGDEFGAQQDYFANIGTAVEHDGSLGLDNAVNVNGVRDSGVAMQSSPSTNHGLSPEAASKARKHNRQRSIYDGSDYGSDTDFDNDGITPALESRMAAIESLARRGTEENGSAADQVIKRVTEQLRDLGSQIAIENGATRLKTAHDALTTHLTHQSRTLTSLTASFSGPRPALPSPEDIETLLPLIQSTLELLPSPPTEPLISLAHLTLSTRELLHHLANVSDTLHMSRQTTANATRRLRTSKEQLHEWKRENEKTEEGQMYIEKGDWDRRLKEREAKRACANVVEGFEDVCGMWRKRLCEGLGVASEDYPENKERRWPKLVPLRIAIPERDSREREEFARPPTPGSPVKRYVEHYKRLSRRASEDSMFPDSRDEMMGGWL